MPGVVAPVVAVEIGHGRHRRLLLVGVGREGGQVAAGSCHCDWSSSTVAMSNAGSRCTWVRPARASFSRCSRAVRLDGEGAERAAQRRGNGRVAGAEVADVQLVERDVLGRGQARLGQAVPARRLEVGARARSTIWLRRLLRDEAHRVRVGHQVALDAPVARVHTSTS